MGELKREEIEAILARHEQFIKNVGRGIVRLGVELEYEDICQLLRLKAWRGIVTYDPAKAKQTRDGYVTQCVLNKRKDILSLKRHGDMHIEEMTLGDYGVDEEETCTFTGDYLAVSEEDTFAEVNDDPVSLPNTLTPLEREVVFQMYQNFSQVEIARAMDIDRRAVEGAVRSLRVKLADWRPTPSLDAARAT